jgi:hypothetical protein
VSPEPGKRRGYDLASLPRREPAPGLSLLAPGHDTGQLGQSPRRAAGLALARDPLSIMDGQPLGGIVMLAGDACRLSA